MRLRELVRGKLAELGYEVELFGLHSFRAGGATKVANTDLQRDSLKGTGGGSLRVRRMVILKIPWSIG